MTTYTIITEAETDPDAPATSSLWKRWWKNPLAMFEGAAGAPRLEFAALAAWAVTAGGVGTYCFARGTGDVAFGATVAGSTLTPTSAAYGWSGGTVGSGSSNVGAAQAGTWKCMGTFDLSWVTGGTQTGSGATLWLRIS